MYSGFLRRSNSVITSFEVFESLLRRRAQQNGCATELQRGQLEAHAKRPWVGGVEHPESLRCAVEPLSGLTASKIREVGRSLAKNAAILFQRRSRAREAQFRIPCSEECVSELPVGLDG